MRGLQMMGVGALLLLPGCSKNYEVRFAVTVSPGVEIPAGAVLSYSVLERDEEFDKTSAEARDEVTEGKREFTRTVNICCAPDPTVRLYAFVDLNANGQHEADEPWGQDPQTPLALDDVESPYTATITIDGGPRI